MKYLALTILFLTQVSQAKFYFQPNPAKTTFENMSVKGNESVFVEAKELKNIAMSEIEGFKAESFFTGSTRRMPVSQIMKIEPRLRCFATTYLITGKDSNIIKYARNNSMTKIQDVAEDISVLRKIVAQTYLAYSCVKN